MGNIKDLYQDSDGWILLLAYKHVGGENKALVQGTAPTFPTEGYSHVWLNDLGLTAADVDSVRFYCHTSGSGRKVHFSTSDATIKSFLMEIQQGTKFLCGRLERTSLATTRQICRMQQHTLTQL